MSSGEVACVVRGAQTLYAIASQAIVRGWTLSQTALRSWAWASPSILASALEEGRILAPDRPSRSGALPSQRCRPQPLWSRPEEVEAIKAAAGNGASDDMVRMFLKRGPGGRQAIARR